MAPKRYETIGLRIVAAALSVACFTSIAAAPNAPVRTALVPVDQEERRGFLNWARWVDRLEGDAGVDVGDDDGDAGPQERLILRYGRNLPIVAPRELLGAMADGERWIEGGRALEVLTLKLAGRPDDDSDGRLRTLALQESALSALEARLGVPREWAESGYALLFDSRGTALWALDSTPERPFRSDSVVREALMLLRGLSSCEAHRGRDARPLEGTERDREGSSPGPRLRLSDSALGSRLDWNVWLSALEGVQEFGSVVRNMRREVPNGPAYMLARLGARLFARSDRETWRETLHACGSSADSDQMMSLVTLEVAPENGTPTRRHLPQFTAFSLPPERLARIEDSLRIPDAWRSTGYFLVYSPGSGLVLDLVAPRSATDLESLIPEAVHFVRGRRCGGPARPVFPSGAPAARPIAVAEADTKTAVSAAPPVPIPQEKGDGRGVRAVLAGGYGRPAARPTSASSATGAARPASRTPSGTPFKIAMLREPLRDSRTGRARTLEGWSAERGAEAKRKAVVVCFWATWCVPCLNERDELRRMIEEYSDRADFVAVANDEPQRSALVNRFLDEKRIRCASFMEESPALARRLQSKGPEQVPVYPAFAVFGRDGRLLETVTMTIGTPEGWKKVSSVIEMATR